MSKSRKIVDILNDALKGKRIEYKNSRNRKDIQVVEKIKFTNHTQDIPDSPQNDWWGYTKRWTTLDIYLANGDVIEFDASIKVIEE